MPACSVFTLDPFAMCRALPNADYYGSSAASQPHHPAMWLAAKGKIETLPTFTRHRSWSEALGFTPEGMSNGHTQRPAGPSRGNPAGRLPIHWREPSPPPRPHPPDWSGRPITGPHSRCVFLCLLLSLARHDHLMVLIVQYVVRTLHPTRCMPTVKVAPSFSRPL